MKRPFFLSLIPKLFLLLAFFASPDTRADTYLGPASYLSDLLQRAQHEQLAEAQEWKLLGHYLSSPLFGTKSEVDGPQFFLSPNGKYSPQDELLATLRAFFDPLAWHKEEKNHPQCRYPARRRWLTEKLNLKAGPLKLLDCRFTQEWKRKLNAGRLSLIFASSYMNNPSSLFGHTFFKFHSQDGDDRQDLLNYGLNFAATTGSDGGMAFMVKGLFGGYPGEFSMTPYYLKLLEYSNVEGRDIWDYELDLTADEIDRLIDHLLELEPSHFDYYFFSENCSYQLLALLEWARPSLRLRDHFVYHVIPMDTIHVLVQTPGMIRRVRHRPALRQELEERLKLLSPHERELLSPFFGDASWQALLQKLGPLDTESRAKMLDAALAYSAMKEIRDREKWREPIFQLQSRRAELGTLPRPLGDSTPVYRPDQAHLPARLGLGGGRQEAGAEFYHLDFRFAYHELSDSARGLLAGSHIQILSAQLRWLAEPEKLELTRARLADLISLSPWGIYQKPISWKLGIGYENTFHEDAAYLSGGSGASFSILSGDRLLIGGMADVELRGGQNEERGYYAGAGPSLVIRYEPNSDWRLVLDARTLLSNHSGHWSRQIQAELAWNLNRFHQLHFRFKSKQEDHLDEKEGLLLWESFWLL